jgi:uncharacterized protein DUF2510
VRASRSNLPYLIAAAGGALLVVSLFLAWFSVDGGSASLWEVASGIDIVLALLGIAAAAIAGARVAGGALPAPPEALKWIGVVAATIVLAYVIESDNLGFGAFLGLLAALAILGGAILAERPDLAGRVADAAGIADERPAAAPPSGLGSGSSTSTPAGSTTPPAASASPPSSTPAAGPAPNVQPATGAGGAAPSATPGPAPSGGGQAASSGPPPGWYPDPQGQARLRYWDGAAWTEQTSA